MAQRLAGRDVRVTFRDENGEVAVNAAEMSEKWKEFHTAPEIYFDTTPEPVRVAPIWPAQTPRNAAAWDRLLRAVQALESLDKER